MKLTRQFSKSEKTLLAFVAILLLAAVYYFGIYSPTTSQLEDIKTQQQDVDSELITEEAKTMRLATMRKELETLELAGNFVETPAYDNQQPVITMLNAILSETKDYSLTFQEITMPESGTTVRRPVQMTFNCSSYQQARNVIGRLHDGPYRCLISALSFAIDNGEGGAVDEATASISNSGVTVTLLVTYFENL